MRHGLEREMANRQGSASSQHALPTRAIFVMTRACNWNFVVFYSWVLPLRSDAAILSPPMFSFYFFIRVQASGVRDETRTTRTCECLYTWNGLSSAEHLMNETFVRPPRCHRASFFKRSNMALMSYNSPITIAHPSAAPALHPTPPEKPENNSI